MIEERRIVILERASELFDLQSPANVSLRDVAKAAGVSKSLILKKWLNRSGFIIAVLEFERNKIANIWMDIDEDSSLETLCFKILSSYRVNPRYFSLFAKVSIDCHDEEIKNWQKERSIYTEFQGIIQKLHSQPELQQWSPESIALFASICTFALPALGPNIMGWLDFPLERQSQIESETLMLFMQAMVGRQ
jgi:AcrR family transcriptional regulator